MGDSKRYTCPEPNPFLEEGDNRNQASVAYKYVLLSKMATAAGCMTLAAIHYSHSA